MGSGNTDGISFGFHELPQKLRSFHGKKPHSTGSRQHDVTVLNGGGINNAGDTVKNAIIIGMTDGNSGFFQLIDQRRIGISIVSSYLKSFFKHNESKGRHTDSANTYEEKNIFRGKNCIFIINN